MGSRRAWDAYPPTYRPHEMKTLARWIRAGESGSIVGLAGAGKSNLLGFLCHRPQIMAQRYLQGALKIVLVWVDLNNLTGYDLATFFRVILRSLYEASAQLARMSESLPGLVQGLYRKVEDKTDPFLSQSALREVLLSFGEQDIRLVLVLDPFDRFCRAVPTLILDNLRGLRDSFKATLCYVVGLRCELTYVRDPAELGELVEILDTHVCWLGTMERDDARWVIAQVEEEMNVSFSGEHIERLIDLTGGYPALLRAASLWLAQASPAPDVTTWEKHLNVEPSVQNRLEEIWQGLTSEEQLALSVLLSAVSMPSERERSKAIGQVQEDYGRALARLQARHLCADTGTGWVFFSPLWAHLVASIGPIVGGQIRYDSKTDRFHRGEQELNALTEQDRRLLHHLMSYPLVAHTIDDLIDAAWPEYDSSGVSNVAVQQAIRHLRKQIEPNPAAPCYLVTQRGTGYRFFPEGMPQT